MRHLRVYKAVDAVARQRSIRAAAYGLAISPSALNRQILGLEEELGVELFERLARGVRLSTAGEIYLNAFRAHFAELERAASQISDLAGLRSGTVRLGVGPELASGVISKVATRYQAEFPDLDLEISIVACDRVSEALQSFETDLHVGVNPILDEAVEVLHSQEAQVACVGRLMGALPAAVRLSELVGASLVVNSKASGLRRALDASFSAKSMPVRYAFISDYFDASSLTAPDDALVLAIDKIGVAGSGAQPAPQVATIDPRDLSALFIKVLRLKSRILPVGSARLAERLIETLSGIDL